MRNQNYFFCFSTQPYVEGAQKNHLNSYVVGTQMNRLNETVLLSTQTYVKIDGEENIHILCSKFVFIQTWFGLYFLINLALFLSPRCAILSSL